MGWWFVKQPNGKYAVFSSVVDDFIFIDGTREELEEFYIDERMRDVKREFNGMLQHADEDQAQYVLKPRKGDGLKRWRECLGTIKRVHGAKRVKEYEHALKTGDFSKFYEEVPDDPGESPGSESSNINSQ